MVLFESSQTLIRTGMAVFGLEWESGTRDGVMRIINPLEIITSPKDTSTEHESGMTETGASPL